MRSSLPQYWDMRLQHVSFDVEFYHLSAGKRCFQGNANVEIMLCNAKIAANDNRTNKQLPWPQPGHSFSCKRDTDHDDVKLGYQICQGVWAGLGDSLF